MSDDVVVTDDLDRQPDATPRPRGSLGLYVIAFLLLIGAGACLTASATGFLASTRLLWTSAVLSGLAIVAAIVAVTLPRR